MFRSSEQINELATALALAQGEIKGAQKSAFNSGYKSKYADIFDVVEAYREPLSKHGLSLVQIPSTTESGAISMETYLLHKSGQWITGDPLMAKPARNDIQGIGGVITYMRRYCSAAFVGVAQADDDDDGEMDRQAQTGNQQSHKPAVPANKPQARQSEAKELPLYPGSELAANRDQWVGLIKSGTRTAEQIILAIKTRYSLSPAQESTIKSLGNLK